MKKGAKKVSFYVSLLSLSQEVYTNLFSGLLFKRKKKKSKKNINNGYMSANEFISPDDDEFNIENENDISTNNIMNTDNINMINNKNENSKINGPNNCPEFETTENESFIFAIEGFNDENILRTANALNQALNKKNDQVDINPFWNFIVCLQNFDGLCLVVLNLILNYPNKMIFIITTSILIKQEKKYKQKSFIAKKLQKN